MTSIPRASRFFRPTGPIPPTNTALTRRSDSHCGRDSHLARGRMTKRDREIAQDESSTSHTKKPSLRPKCSQNCSPRTGTAIRMVGYLHAGSERVGIATRVSSSQLRRRLVDRIQLPGSGPFANIKACQPRLYVEQRRAIYDIQLLRVQHSPVDS